jgi:hypothetical protein
MALKTLVAEIPAKDGAVVVRRLTSRLINAVATVGIRYLGYFHFTPFKYLLHPIAGGSARNQV